MSCRGTKWATSPRCSDELVRTKDKQDPIGLSMLLIFRDQGVGGGSKIFKTHNPTSSRHTSILGHFVNSAHL